MSDRQKYTVLFLILAALFFIAVCSGLYILFLHRTTVSSTQDLPTVSMQDAKQQAHEKAYQDAIEALSNQQYDAAYEHLKELKDAGVRAGAFKDAEQLFFYASARRSYVQKDIPAARESIQRISPSYKGLFSRDVENLRAELSASDGGVLSEGDAASSQRMLAAQMEYVNTRLSARLDAINNARKQADLQYKQGALTGKDYYKAKAQLDLEEQNARIEALDEEIALIKDVQYPSAEEKERALRTAETRRKPLLEKQSAAQKSIEDVDRVNREFSKIR